VLIACGGTGGHLFPGIAVAQELIRNGHRCTLLISEKKIDALAASAHPQLRFVTLPALAMPKWWSRRMPAFLLSLWRQYRQCRDLIAAEGVSAVLGMGGFTSLMPLRAGRRAGCVTLIHESNAIMGKANRINARYADLVLCGMQACHERLGPVCRSQVIGTPLRESMNEAVTRAQACSFFGLDAQRKTLLVVGGSQGAQAINLLVARSLAQLEAMGWQLLHVTGPADYAEVRLHYAQHPTLAQYVSAFCHRMELAYAAADVALGRSGASTLAELAHFALPSLLVPYPHAAEDHQTRNAEVFQQAGAAVLMPQNLLNEDSLLETLGQLSATAGRLQEMSVAASQLARPQCAQQIAALIPQLVEGASRNQGCARTPAGR
jgi:UDP-N-acetylglucosamine--N-acetylmuramyl-(pentapeptide) pyrophosphoryl-undecaprenol N-acetylglucosamine transferase